MIWPCVNAHIVNTLSCFRVGYIKRYLNGFRIGDVFPYVQARTVKPADPVLGQIVQSVI